MQENHVMSEAELNNYIETRREQLYGLSKEWGDLSVKYLFIVNGSGAMSTLAYLGAKENAPLYVFHAFSCFVFGVIIVGVLIVYTFHDMETLFDNFMVLVRKYHQDEIGQDVLLKSDDEQVNKNANIPYILGYGAFSAFIVGCMILGCGILV